MPAISGNEINGLNDPTPRRPRIVYWAPDPSEIPHGEMQGYFYQQSAKVPEFGEKRAQRMEIAEAPLPPLAEQKRQATPVEWTGDLDQFVASDVCDMTGVAEMNPEWVFEGYHIAQSRVIMLGVQHNYDAIAKAPEVEAGLQVVDQYIRAARAAKIVAGWIRTQGWEAEAVTGPMTGALTMIPPALACGFGELGKHGSIINPEFGASFRLSAVLTDAPFAVTPAGSHGVDDFCQNCRICEDACPPEALSAEKQVVRGVRKWYVDFDRCLPFFNQTHGCAICIAVCPWSRPGVGVNLAAKLARRAERSAAD
jgi:ferredoxin